METHSCTIVTCYYKFYSKHSFEDYDKWIKTFLTNIETPMVIFTDEISYDKIYELRKWNKDTVIIKKNLYETYCAQFMNYWNRDMMRDIERNYHNQNLYIVWNEKSKFVEEAIRGNYFNTEYYCWCDIGCFRENEGIEKYKNFPKIDKIISTKTQDKLQLLYIRPFLKDEIYFINKIKNNQEKIINIFGMRCHIGATIMIGHTKAWNNWIPAYYNLLYEFMKNDTFTGKDQNIMGMLVNLEPNLVNLIVPPTIDSWFYLQDYFS